VLLPIFLPILALDFVHHAVADLRFIQGDVVLPHGLGVAAEGDGGIVVADPGHPCPGHGRTPEVVELELLDVGVGLEVSRPGLRRASLRQNEDDCGDPIHRDRGRGREVGHANGLGFDAHVAPLSRDHGERQAASVRTIIASNLAE